jgi:nitroreductase
MQEFNNFLELARKRQSDRSYSDQPVEKEQLLRCLQAARLAPSACNSQPWFFVVVDKPELQDEMAGMLSGAIMNKFAGQAPVLIAAVSEKPALIPRLAGYIKKKPYYLMDLAMAVEHLCLQAASENLGTCILGWFNEKGVKKLLGIPRSKRVPLVITLGHPQESTPREKNRKNTEATWSFNSYTPDKTSKA